MLERRPLLPREKENWDTAVALNTTRYFGPDLWQDRDGGDLRAGMCYHVGGNTKVYGAALFRLRERDFEAVNHVDGVSPEWPLKYADWEPWYQREEELYQVHGEVGHDPTEPRRRSPYPWPAVSHEPRIAEIVGAMRDAGLRPSPTPLGQIQTLGKVGKTELEGSEAVYAPLDIEFVSNHSVDWWLTTEDLPYPNNQVRLARDGRIVIDYTENNGAEFDRLMNRWKVVLKEIGCGCHILPNGKYFNAGTVTTFTNKLGINGLGHQVGTARFGEDSTSSVLDLNCRAHDIDNLYVVDGSFFVSSAAVNPTLTIIANALRVGSHLRDRLRVGVPPIANEGGVG